MCPKRFVAYSQAALICLASLGCAGFPMFRSSAPATPLGTARPSLMKQFTSAVSESKLGKSVSTVFAGDKKKAALKNDPTSLANGIVPTTAADYVALGESLEENGDGEGARRMFHQALEHDPHNLSALVALGRHFDRQGQLDRATESYLEATKYHPTSPVAFNDLGLCLARQRRYDDAAQALKRAIRLEPDRVLYRNNIAMVLVAQNRIDEALVHLSDAHGPAIAHYNIGCLLGKQGRNDVALEQFKLALANDPSLNEAREWIESLSVDGVPGEAARMLASQPAVTVPAADVPPTDAAPAYQPRYRENVAVRPADPPLATPASNATAPRAAPVVLPVRR